MLHNIHTHTEGGTILTAFCLCTNNNLSKSNMYIISSVWWTSITRQIYHCNIIIQPNEQKSFNMCKEWRRMFIYSNNHCLLFLLNFQHNLWITVAVSNTSACSEEEWTSATIKTMKIIPLHCMTYIYQENNTKYLEGQSSFNKITACNIAWANTTLIADILHHISVYDYTTI